MDLDLSGAPGLGLELTGLMAKPCLSRASRLVGSGLVKLVLGQLGWVGFLNEKLVN